MEKKEKPKWTTSGIDYSDGKFVEDKLFEVELSEQRPPNPTDITTFGKPITRKAAQEMIESRYWKKIKEEYCNSSSANREEILNKNLAITFSKEILTFILSQANCAGIKFYFCNNHKDKPEQSIVLVGVDIENRDLGTKDTIIEYPGKKSSNTSDASKDLILYEVGGPKKVRDYTSKSEQELKGDFFSKAVKEYFDCESKK